MRIQDILIRESEIEQNSLSKVTLEYTGGRTFYINYLKHNTEVEIQAVFTEKECNQYSVLKDIYYCKFYKVETLCLPEIDYFNFERLLKISNFNLDVLYYFSKGYKKGKVRLTFPLGQLTIRLYDCIDIPVISPYSGRPMTATVFDNLRNIENNISSLLISDSKTLNINQLSYDVDPLFEVFSFSVLQKFPKFTKKTLFGLLQEDKETFNCIHP